jgi:uncharacterized protein (DUF1501 family)
MEPLCQFSPTRRAFLGTSGALFAWSFIPTWAHAAATRDPRLICVVLRGALDGLSIVPPLGDPDYVGLREEIALHKSGDKPAIPLDGFFGLHPAMPNLARLYRAGQALVVHATATGYRKRSHFDGQDVLESGQPGPGNAGTGWLNRLIGTLPAGERTSRHGALGVGIVPPLITRGPAPVMGWAPTPLVGADDDLTARLLNLYEHQDPFLANALRSAQDTDQLIGGNAAGNMRGARARPMPAVAAGAARICAAEDGPRIGALAFDGWDTHAKEGGAEGRLAKLLGQLDDALAAFETNLGARWKDSVLLIVTEFGRTARINGSSGTDHGTGTVALLVGGAVKGGRVLADWPGLKDSNLLESRDLAPTVDLRGVAKGVIADLYGVSPQVLANVVFPQTASIPAMRGLIA